MIEKMGSDSESLKDSKECSSSNSSYFNFDKAKQRLQLLHTSL